MDVPSIEPWKLYKQSDFHTASYMLRACDITIIDDLANNGMVLYHSVDSV